MTEVPPETGEVPGWVTGTPPDVTRHAQCLEAQGGSCTGEVSCSPAVLSRGADEFSRGCIKTCPRGPRSYRHTWSPTTLSQVTSGQVKGKKKKRNLRPSDFHIVVEVKMMSRYLSSVCGRNQWRKVFLFWLKLIIDNTIFSLLLHTAPRDPTFPRNNNDPILRHFWNFLPSLVVRSSNFLNSAEYDTLYIPITVSSYYNLLIHYGCILIHASNGLRCLG